MGKPADDGLWLWIAIDAGIFPRGQSGFKIFWHERPHRVAPGRAVIENWSHAPPRRKKVHFPSVNASMRVVLLLLVLAVAGCSPAVESDASHPSYGMALTNFETERDRLDKLLADRNALMRAYEKTIRQIDHDIAAAEALRRDGAEDKPSPTATQNAENRDIAELSQDELPGLRKEKEQATAKYERERETLIKAIDAQEQKLKTAAELKDAAYEREYGGGK
jgi:hypothetical protein